MVDPPFIFDPFPLSKQTVAFALSQVCRMAGLSRSEQIKR
jgi:hypothetical protein